MSVLAVILAVSGTTLVACQRDEDEKNNDCSDQADESLSEPVKQDKTLKALERLDRSLRRMSQSFEENDEDFGPEEFNFNEPPDSKLHRALSAMGSSSEFAYAPSRADRYALICLDQCLQKISKKRNSG